MELLIQSPIHIIGLLFLSYLGHQSSSVGLSPQITFFNEAAFSESYLNNSRQHCRVCILSYFCWLWQILRQASLSVQYTCYFYPIWGAFPSVGLSPQIYLLNGVAHSILSINRPAIHAIVLFLPPNGVASAKPLLLPHLGRLPICLIVSLINLF